MTPAAAARPPCIRHVVVAVALLVLSAGCATFSDPLSDSPAGAAPAIDMAPYIGTWYLAEAEDDSSIEVVATGPTELSATLLGEGGLSYAFDVRLATVDGRLVASIGQADETVAQRGWWLAAPEFDRALGSLTFTLLDADRVVRAVESGVLDAEPVESVVDDMMATAGPTFTADGDALRAFLQAAPDAFDGGAEVELTRIRPAVAAAAPPDDPAAAAPSQVQIPYGTRGGSAAYPGQSVVRPTPPSYAPPLTWTEPLPPAAAPPSYPPADLADAGPPDVGGAGLLVGSRRGGSPFQSRLLTALGVVLLAGVLAALGIGVVLDRRPRVGGSTASPSAAHAGGSDGAAAGWDDDGPGPTVAAAVRRYGWPVVLVVALVAGPVVLAWQLLGGFTTAPGQLGLSFGSQAWARAASPIVLVFALGGLIGLAEVSASFPRFAPEALRTPAALALVLFNAAVTAVAYAAAVSANATAYGAVDRPGQPLGRALAVTAVVAILLRSHLVLARGMGGQRPPVVGLDLGWPYARLQSLCRLQIDRRLLGDRRYAAQRLVTLGADVDALERLARSAIGDRPAGDADALDARLAALVAAGTTYPADHLRLARFAADVAGPDRVRSAIEEVEVEAVSSDAAESA